MKTCKKSGIMYFQNQKVDIRIISSRGLPLKGCRVGKFYTIISVLKTPNRKGSTRPFNTMLEATHADKKRGHRRRERESSIRRSMYHSVNPIHILTLATKGAKAPRKLLYLQHDLNNPTQPTQRDKKLLPTG